MNAKDYLMQIKIYDLQIENTLHDIVHWKDIAMNITSQIKGDKVQSSGTKQKMEAAICKYVDAELDVLDELYESRKEIIETIKQLPASEYDLLHKVYVQGMEIYEAVIEMKRSYTWGTTVHSRALARVQRILNERENDEK